MLLVPFQPGDAPTVSSWGTDPTEVAWWCGYPTAPVPADVIAGWSERPDVRSFAMFEGPTTEVGGAGDEAVSGELVAYGELWLDDDDQEAELARLIVAPAHRGRGVGRQLVAALTRLAREYQPDVFLRVHPDNAAALRCYLGAGFEQVPAADQDDWNAHQPIAYVWLIHPRPTDTS